MELVGSEQFALASKIKSGDNVKFSVDGTEFIREWWKLPSNTFKNSIPEKPSKLYTKKQLIKDYKEKYFEVLKEWKKDIFGELLQWKIFFNKWYDEL